MENNKVNVSVDGLGFCSLLTILFIAFRLSHIIDWSWWWVFAPLWIPVVIFVGCFLVFCFVVIIYCSIKGIKEKIWEKMK